MSEEIKEQPVLQEQPAQEQTVEVKPAASGFAGKSIAELSEIFKEFLSSEDKLSRGHEAETIKSDFYRTLGEVLIKAGAVVDETIDSIAVLGVDFEANKAYLKENLYYAPKKETEEAEPVE